jgi:hypothetical protein
MTASVEASPEVTFRVSGDIPAQVSFWSDSASVRGYIGGLGSGKTFAGAVEILNMPSGSSGVVVAPTFAMMRDASQRTFFEICPDEWIHSHNKAEQITVLANGTTIFWRSADKPRSLRGPNLGWMWVDEAAFVTEDAWRVLIGRIRRNPGRSWVTTTPNGHNWLYQWFVTKDLGYAMHHGRTSDNPHNISSYADDLRRQYAGDAAYAAQELDGQFVDLSGSKRFTGPILAAVYGHKLPMAWRNPDAVKAGSQTYTLPATLRVYSEPEPSRQYVIGVDCAEGVKGGDDSSAVVLDKLSGVCVAVLGGEYEPQEHHGALITLLSRWYNAAPVMIERNNHGHAVIGSCKRHGVVCCNGLDGRAGWQTTALSKAQAYGEANAYLLEAERDGAILLHDSRLKEQLASIDRVTLRAPGKGRMTKVDDEAMGWVLAMQARRASPIAQARSRAAMAKMLGRRR